MKKLLTVICLLFTISCSAKPPFQVHQVEKNIYRGPRPSSIEELKAQIPDVKFIVYLESGWYEEIHNDVYKSERKHAADYGVTVVEHPLSDFIPPTDTELKVVEADIVRLSAQGTVYVHCLYGDDRTGMSIAAYRMLADKWSVDQAKKEMYDMGFHKFPYIYWVPALSTIK